MYKMSSKPFILCKLTNECNQKCIHCVTDACTGGVSRLELNEVKSVLDDAISISNDAVVSFIGGEATIWKNFYELINDDKYKNTLYKKVNTNGTAIPDDKYEDFKKANFFEVRLSLDSEVPYEHDYLRGEGTFEETVHSIKKLKEAGVNVTTGTVVSKLNYNKLPAIIEFIKSLGIDVMHFFAFVADGRGNFHDELVLNDEERKVASEEILKFAKEDYVNRIPLCGENGTAYFTVLDNGDIFINFSEDEVHKKKLGNIKENSFKEIYLNEIGKKEFDIIDCKECCYYNDPIMCANMHTFCIADLDLR